MPIQAEFEGWSALAPPIVIENVHVNYFVRLNHSWRQALRDALSAAIIYHEMPELIHSHGSTITDEFAVSWLHTLQKKHGLK